MGVSGRMALLARGLEFLAQFLAGPDAGVNDVIGGGSARAQTTHGLLGEALDGDRLAHVEDVHPRALQQQRLENEAARLMGGHEVALHRRVRHTRRAAFAKLLFEERRHAALAPEDVAEAHDLALGPVLLGALLAAHVPLSQALGGAQHALRLDGLVGGDENELLGVVRAAQLQEADGRERVVAKGFRRVPLHQRDMLVGGGV